MSYGFCFRIMALITIWLYSAALTQAGQVVTSGDRTWARQVSSLTRRAKEAASVGSTNTIAVLYFNNQTGQANLDALQKGMAVMLIADLSQIDKIQVVARVKLQALLDELGIGASRPASQAQTRNIGKILGSYYVAGGYIIPGKFTKIQIHPNITDVPFKTVVKLDTVVGGVNELLRMEKEVLFNIIKEMHIILSPAENEVLEKPLSTNATALFALFAAIDYSDKAQYDKAAELYREALVEDPKLQMAGDALQELQVLGLLQPGSASYPAAKTGGLFEDGGPSTGMVVGMGVGLALIGGAIALGGGSSGGSSSSASGSQSSTDASETDTTSPTATASTGSGDGSVLCAGDSINYNFSEDMDTSSGSVAVSPSSWNIDSAGWQNSTTYSISWNNGMGDKCLTSSITSTLQSFQDTAGNALATDSTTFEFTSVVN